MDVLMDSTQVTANQSVVSRREKDIHQSCHDEMWRENSLCAPTIHCTRQPLNHVFMKLEHDTADVRCGPIAVPKIATLESQRDKFCHVRRKASLTRNAPGVWPNQRLKA